MTYRSRALYVSDPEERELNVKSALLNTKVLCQHWMSYENTPLLQTVSIPRTRVVHTASIQVARESAGEFIHYQ